MMLVCVGLGIGVGVGMRVGVGVHDGDGDCVGRQSTKYSGLIGRRHHFPPMLRL